MAPGGGRSEGDGAEAEQIRTLGGLLVIGTNRHESARIDDQLRGRAGRQGDPGETAFFVSLEDDLVRRYGILDLLPSEYRAAGVAGEITDRRVNREIDRAQTIIEEQHASMRRTLRQYTLLIEQQRVVVQEIRRTFLAGDAERTAAAMDLSQGATTQVWRQVRDHFPAEAAHQFSRVCERLSTWDGAGFGCQGRDLLREIALSALDEMWSDHLAFVEQIREGIHLQRLGGKDPFLVFVAQVGDAFDAALVDLAGTIASRFKMEAPGAAQGGPHAYRNSPSATWVYLVSDDPFPTFRLSMVSAAAPAAALAAAAVGFARLLTWPLLRLWGVVAGWAGKRQANSR
jgi:preprotein translocase subunit SecA